MTDTGECFAPDPIVARRLSEATHRERIQQAAQAGGWHLINGIGDERYARLDGTFIDVFYNRGSVRTANITAPSGRFKLSRSGEDVLAWLRHAGFIGERMS